MKKIKYDNYLLPKDYNECLPKYYFFNGEKIVLEESLLWEFIKNKKYNKILEFGIGTGRYSKMLAKKCSEYYGVDISESMINETKKFISNGHFYNTDINGFVENNTNIINSIDLFCSFWAYNYGLLSHYEKFDYENKKIIPSKDLNLSDFLCSKMIIKNFQSLRKNTEFLIVFFDSTSIEQQLVTKEWSKIEKFPNDDRAHTLKIFQKNLNDLFNNKEIIYDHTCCKGYVYFENEEELIKGFLNLHFKGIFNENGDLGIIELINQTFKKYANGKGEYYIPAGINVFYGKKI